MARRLRTDIDRAAVDPLRIAYNCVGKNCPLHIKLMDPREIGTSQIRTSEICVARVGIPQVSIGQIGTAQVRIVEARVVEVRVSQISAAQILILELHTSQIRVAQFAARATLPTVESLPIGFAHSHCRHEADAVCHEKHKNKSLHFHHLTTFTASTNQLAANKRNTGKWHRQAQVLRFFNQLSEQKRSTISAATTLEEYVKRSARRASGMWVTASMVPQRKKTLLKHGECLTPSWQSIRVHL